MKQLYFHKKILLLGKLVINYFPIKEENMESAETKKRKREIISNYQKHEEGGREKDAGRMRKRR